MNDAYTEFLTENSQRSYPFVEDSPLVSLTSDVLENDVILDLKAFHRARPEIPFQLKAIVGPASAGVSPYVGVADSYVIYFAAGPEDSPVIWGLQVGISAAGSTPLVVEASVADPYYPDKNLGVVRATIGAGLFSIPFDAFWEFTTAIVEPALVVQPYRNQIDLLKVIHQEGDDDVIGGDVAIRGGYNVNVVPAIKGVSIIPSLGGGSLGRFIGSIREPGTSKCKGVLLSINGILPTTRGEFFITGENGIEIINLPDEHKIRIRVAPPKIGATVC